MSRFENAVLQAFVDGEASPEEVAAIERSMAEDPDLAARVALMRAVVAVAEDGMFAAFGPDPSAAGPSGGGVADAGDPVEESSDGRAAWFGLILAAAAALVVFAVWRSGREPDPVVADQRVENPFFSVQCVPRHGGSWDLFSAVSVELDWKVGAAASVYAMGAGEAAGEALAAASDARSVPVRLSARIEGPAGRVWTAAWAGEPVEIAGDHRQVLALSELQVDDPGVAPLVCVAPGEQGWSHDPNWGMRHLGIGPGLQRFVPQQVGEYRIVIEVASIAAPEGRAWQTFDDAVEVESSFRVSATVGAWSEPVDGMCARVVVPRAHLHAPGLFPFALQLRNDSDRVRRYNVLGVTQVDVPQPFHFNLIVDGEEWDQAERQGPMIPGSLLMIEHTPGTVRSLVVAPSQWSQNGAPLSAKPGDHSVQFRFHSKLLVWNANDRSIWQGELTTPPVKIAVAN